MGITTGQDDFEGYAPYHWPAMSLLLLQYDKGSSYMDSSAYTSMSSLLALPL